jgi:hypothetical protein
VLRDGAIRPFCHVTSIAAKSTSAFIVQEGDSGGPVIKHNPDGLYAVGTIMGGGDQVTNMPGKFKTVHMHELPYVMPADCYLLTQ